MRSTTISQDTTWTWGTSNSGTVDHSPTRRVGREADTLETIVDRLNLDDFGIIPEYERQERLNNIDAVDLFSAVQELNKELSNVRVENYVLTDFLEKNDPKLLIGISARQASIKSATAVNHSRVPTSVSSRSVRSFTNSLSGMSIADKRRTEYKLNYRTKAEMTEKLCVDIERRIRDMEAKEMLNIKSLNAQIEELGILYVETVGTTNNFKLHFLTDENDLSLLENGTERRLEQNFRKFVNNWLKNARALLSTMRLRGTHFQEQCQQLRADLLTKSDLSGILSAVDFEQLVIKRNALLAALEEKNMDMAGLKGVTGKASMAMAKEKQLMMSIEADTRNIKQRTAEIERQIGKLHKEIELVKAGNEKDSENLMELKQQLEQFEAPTVNNYIEKKDELQQLEKEEKMWQRKVSILNLKLSSLMKRCKKLGIKTYNKKF